MSIYDEVDGRSLGAVLLTGDVACATAVGDLVLSRLVQPRAVERGS